MAGDEAGCGMDRRRPGQQPKVEKNRNDAHNSRCGLLGNGQVVRHMILRIGDTLSANNDNSVELQRLIAGKRGESDGHGHPVPRR
jgi:hypothetical protein